jgi:putative transposase
MSICCYIQTSNAQYIVIKISKNEYFHSLGRHKHPTAGCLDNQSVKCTAVPGPRGFDAGKMVNGHKRHMLVDTLGLLLVVVVTVTSVQDRDGARLLLRQLPGNCKKLRKIGVEGRYSGRLGTWITGRFKFCLAVVLRSKQTSLCSCPVARWLSVPSDG